MTDVEREIVLPAPPDEVWDALTHASELVRWFGADIEGELAQAEVTVFRMPDGTERRALVEVADPPHRLVFRWLPYERDAAGATRERAPSRVSIDCAPHPEGTRLRIHESRIEAAVTPLPRIGYRALAKL